MASLLETIAAGVTQAFEALGDLVIEGTLTQPSTIDGVTEAVTPGLTGTWGVVEAEFTQTDVLGGQVEAGDLKVVADNAAKPFEPAPGDNFTWKGITYKIHQANPTQGALWELHLRRPK